MADTFVAVNGTWRRVAEQFVAVSGTMRNASESFVGIDGTWRSTFSGMPDCTLSAVTSSTAPYSRLTYSYLVTGVWTKLEVILVKPGNQQTVLRTYAENGQQATF